ncbi:uncharacterized protein N7479_009536 [Penicillium vulpinum]|uniref:Uncharacterized protein n=1 Tax=Penicillium vulpinum TaxID=29845 RepID=A0A1V6RYC7_9EURO|nr:uncharacterized protein N7479_009536 [Penicillium vulpinum]KAJ5951123.1 hypothetical protein N7479_009536 [Penicillium vulpinum]OQE06792.1 hypothetical protein PENVUL_c016G06546 [Penicillium vulpinum]
MPEEDEAKDAVLPKIPQLTMETNISEWCSTVDEDLHPNYLNFIVDVSIPHPKLSDPDYKNWYQWSTTVYRLLYSSMDEDVQNMIDKLSNQPEVLLTCWLFNAVKTMASNRTAIQAANQWRKWYALHRSNYPSAAAYIIAYRTQYDIVRKLDQAPSFFISLWALLQELRNELPEARCAIEYLALHKSPESIDYDTFAAHCHHMVTKSNKPDLAFNNNLPGRDTPRPRGFELPNHRSAKSWVKEWRHHKPQRECHGWCSFCGIDRHRCRRCPYLKKNPHVGFSLQPGIRCYS